MRVFLTGATGFLGSHTLDRLIDAGHEVGALIRPESDRWRIAHRDGQYRPISGILADAQTYERDLRDLAPEVVLHLAWGGVQNAFRNDTTQLNNVFEAAELVSVAQRCGARRFVGLGSQAEYGPRQATLTEDEPTTPSTLYGAAKLSACHTTRVLCDAAGMEWAWARLFSSYGPRDNPSWLIPYLTLALLRGEEPALTAAEQRWDYVYGPDAAEAVVVLARAGRGVHNLGSGAALPLRQIIEMVRDNIDATLPLGFGKVAYRPDQVMLLCADISRLRAVGWTPATPLERGVRETVAWFTANRHRFQQ